MFTERKKHWETIYATKLSHEVSWTQTNPSSSLALIREFNVSKTASIIDVGGGDSKLVDCLIEDGYQNITVLDISEHALQKARQRLGAKADSVTWIVSDVTEFNPTAVYDVWHDRATFHFLTSEEQVNQYLSIAGKATKGFMAIGTFSENGPEKCSGLPIRQYTEQQLTKVANTCFEKLRCFNEDHVTPFNTVQNFLFCGFRKSAA